MFAVEVYAAVRRFVFVEGHSRREAARVFGLSRETVLKMCRFSLPPGYTRTLPISKPKLGALLPVIDAILEADRSAPAKQRHTAKRIFERLRDEHGFAGGYTVVKDHVRIGRAGSVAAFRSGHGKAEAAHGETASGGRGEAGRVLQGTAVHRRGDPLGRPLVPDVPDQLPRSRADAGRPRRWGRPHYDFPLNPGLCAGVGEADPAAPAGLQRLVARRRDLCEGEGPLGLPVSGGRQPR